MKRIIALLCAILLVLPLTTQASAAENTTITLNDNLYRVAELDELRTTNSETFILSDGSCEAVVYAYDKYYQDEDGKLCLIDNSIVAISSVLKPMVNASNVSEYKYKNTSNDMDVYFKEFTPDVMVSTTNNTLSFSPINVNKTTAQVGGSRDYPQISDYLLAGANFICYPEIYNKTDFVYAVDNGLVKEYIILKDKTALQRFAFSVNSKGYEVKNNNGQTIDFVDSSGDIAFSFGKLFAIDSSNSYTDDLSYSVITDGTNTTITFAFNDTWASSNERTFPILIDPSVMVSGSSCTYDSYVSSRYPTTNYQMNTYLRTGRDEDFYIRRSYIKFDLPTYIDENNADKITSAYISLKKYSGASPNVKAYRCTKNWDSSSITWNNKPTDTTVNASGLATLSSDNWYRLYITNIVKSWFTNTTNYGVVLKDNSESSNTQWTTFYSSDAASPNKPELHIVYDSIIYRDNGYISSSIDIYPYSFSSPWQTSVNKAIASWNNTSAPINFYTTTSSKNMIYVKEHDTQYLGYMNPIATTGGYLSQFAIVLVSENITEAAQSGNLANYIQSTMVHELGHTIWLADNPITSAASIMKYSRDRNTMINPSTFDILNVDAKY